MRVRVRRWKVLLAGPLVALPLAGALGVLLVEPSPEAPAEAGALAQGFDPQAPARRAKGRARGPRVSAPPPPSKAAGAGALPLAPEEKKDLSVQVGDAERGLGERVKALQALEQSQGASAALLASLARLDPSKDKSAITLRPVLLASLVRKYDDAAARHRVLEAIGPGAPLAERLLVIGAITGAVRPEWLRPHLIKLEEEDPNPKIRKKAGQVLQQLSERQIASR